MVSGLASRDGISVRHGDGWILYHIRRLGIQNRTVKRTLGCQPIQARALRQGNSSNTDETSSIHHLNESVDSDEDMAMCLNFPPWKILST